MPSKLPMVSFVISNEDLDVVKQYQNDNGIKSLSKAFIAIIEKGIDVLEQETEKAPPTRDEALLEYFGLLNKDGQNKVIDYARLLVVSGEHLKNSADKLA